MGYAVLHIDKAKGSDSGVTAHIERTYTPNNVDASRTHLNRELVQFPENDTSRTQAIEHRIATAGIYRKVADNQVRALRFILSGSHEDMLRIEKNGRLSEWCEASMDWLRQTIGAENVVAATLHADEETPHIHATVVPIVQGERRKAKDEADNGKRKYKTKRNKVRLCADFGNSELDKAEQRIEALKKEAEQAQYLSEQEKNNIRKEVVVLKDRLKDKDRELEQRQKELKAYEEDRSFIQRFMPPFFALLNVRRLLAFMGFSDEQVAQMYRTGEAVRAKAKVYSSMYRRYFEEDDTMLCIEKDQKQKPFLSINGLSVPDWCEHKWQQLIKRNRGKRL
ncbi:MobV family relaxase [Porphyromonas gulae]|uniref:Mobilization protein n=1 Tax=Porphyromonas gulae TaxID=111105 RepID=A0A0A2F6G8_9PORP|nr:MobV family relaxase [Porphyromonas gulae]KGN85647.1 mobilization protein [Porphyromonas gulae]